MTWGERLLLVSVVLGVISGAMLLAGGHPWGYVTLVGGLVVAVLVLRTWVRRRRSAESGASQAQRS